MTIFTAAIEQASDILWNSLLLFLLVGTGVFFTIRLRGVHHICYCNSDSICTVWIPGFLRD